jgi:hypothetical protein
MTVPDASVTTFGKKVPDTISSTGVLAHSALRFRGRLSTTRLLPVDTFFARSDGTLLLAWTELFSWRASLDVRTTGECEHRPIAMLL